jgi:ABC-2 type transport system permease protein
VTIYLTAVSAGAWRAWRAPAELAVRVLFYTVILVVMAALWRAATPGSAQVAGYPYAALVWYFMTAEAAVVATKPRMIETIGSDIGSGQVAVEMLRPVSVLALRVAWEFGESLVRFGCAAPLGVAAALLLAGGPPAPAAALLALPSALLAVLCNLVAQHAFAAAAFWMNEAKAMWFLYQKLIFLCGGMLLPIEIFPAWLETLSRALPFWTMAYAPARLASGDANLFLLGGQALWLAALSWIAAAVFVRGERRVQVGGG